MDRKVYLTELEAELILHEITVSLRSIQWNSSSKEKGEFKAENYEGFNIDDFDLSEAELTTEEFESYISLCSKILRGDKPNSSQE